MIFYIVLNNIIFLFTFFSILYIKVSYVAMAMVILLGFFSTISRAPITLQGPNIPIANRLLEIQSIRFYHKSKFIVYLFFNYYF